MHPLFRLALLRLSMNRLVSRSDTIRTFFKSLSWNCSFLLLESSHCHKIPIIPKYPAARSQCLQNAEGREIWALGGRNCGKNVIVKWGPESELRFWDVLCSADRLQEGKNCAVEKKKEI
jgi:hypothetical protein